MKNSIVITNKELETYPLWDKLTAEVMNSEKLKKFRHEKETEGYKIASGNQLIKDNIVYWLMFDESLNCWLQEYGKLA